MNNRSEQTTIRLTPIGEAENTENRRRTFPADFFVLWFFTAAFAVFLSSVFKLNTEIPAIIAAAVYAALFSICEILEKQKFRFAFLILTTVWLLVLFPANGLIFGGIRQIFADICDRIGAVYPFEIFVFDIEEGNAAAGLVWLMYPLSVKLAIMMRKGSRIPMILTAAVVLLCMAASGILAAPAAEVLYFLAFAAMIFRTHMRGVKGKSASFSQFQLLLILAALTAFVFLFMGIFIPVSKNDVPELFNSVIESLSDKIGDFRYATESDVLPEGDFKGLGAALRSDKSALEITMDEPASYYLRGFIGSEYTKSGWKQTDAETIWSQKDSLYVLHNDGFFAQEQLSLAAEALLAEEKTAQNISVNITGADHKYIYVPYELAGSEDILKLSEKRLGDENVTASGIRGESTYSYRAMEPLIADSLKIAGTLSTEQTEEAAKEYQSEEETYNIFVYDTCLTVPDEIRVTLKQLFNESNPGAGEEHADYSEVKEKIVYLLDKEITYNENLAESWDGFDFIQEFLDGTKEGYDIHYASAAVMMFRYYGIPARYVEGYLVTKDDAASMKAGEGYTITEKNAHAWVEYYQDGAGWLPFEVLPSYMDQMESVNEYQDFSGLSRESGGGSASGDESEPETQEDEEEEQGIDWLFVTEVILIIAIILVLLFILGLFVWVILKRREVKKMKAAFDDQDARTAVRGMFSYTMNLLAVSGMKIRNTSLYHYAGPIGKAFDEGMKAEYEEVVDIRQKAVYSDHELSEDERREVKEFEEKVWNRVYSEGSLWEKFQLKFVYYL